MVPIPAAVKHHASNAMLFRQLRNLQASCTRLFSFPLASLHDTTHCHQRPANSIINQLNAQSR
jgi:hypothetical protein